MNFNQEDLVDLAERSIQARSVTKSEVERRIESVEAERFKAIVLLKQHAINVPEVRTWLIEIGFIPDPIKIQEIRDRQIMYLREELQRLENLKIK